jgi:lysozyme
MLATLRGRLITGVAASGIALVAYYEGYKPQAYVDPVGIVTVCYGHTATARLGQSFTQAQCDTMLRSDLAVAERAVKRRVLVDLGQPQFDALVSLTYNVGEGNFATSTLLRTLNKGDYCGAARQFPRWNRAGGRVLPGLTKRRLAEQALFLEGLDCGIQH